MGDMRRRWWRAPMEVRGSAVPESWRRLEKKVLGRVIRRRDRLRGTFRRLWGRVGHGRRHFFADQGRQMASLVVAEGYSASHLDALLQRERERPLVK